MDLDAERAASRQRREQVRDENALDVRARMCRRKLLPRHSYGRVPASLEEAAIELYPNLEPEERAAIVARAHELGNDRGRPVTEILATARVKELTRAYLAEHRGATASEVWRHVLVHGQPTIQQQSHAVVVSEIRKELGISVRGGPRPKSEGPTPANARARTRGKASEQPARAPAAPPPPPPPPPARTDGTGLELNLPGIKVRAQREGERWRVEFEGVVAGHVLASIVDQVVDQVVGSLS